MDFTLKKVITINEKKYTLGLIDHRTWLNFGWDASSGKKLGELVYDYLPYMLIHIEGCKTNAGKVEVDGRKTRIFSPDWIEQNIDPDTAVELYNAGLEFQTLTLEESKNSSGRQRSPKSKKAQKASDAQPAKKKEQANAQNLEQTTA